MKRQKHFKIALVAILWLGISTASLAQTFLVFQVNNPYQRRGRTLWGTLYVMQRHTNGDISLTTTYHCVYGLHGVGKEVLGDKRTPLGIYKITQKQRTDDVKRYGKWLLRVNYPNADDRKNGRTGSGIAIHGGRVNGTLGCMRILDGSKYRKKLGVNNINALAKITKVGTQIIVCENINPQYLAFNDGYLSKEKAKYWSDNILGKTMSREKLTALLQAEPTPEIYTHIGRVPKMFVVKKTNIQVSNVLKNDVEKYGGHHLQDKKSHTAWVGDRRKTNWIKYHFPSAYRIHKMAIQVGYAKTDYGGDNLWLQNSRPATVRIHFGNGESEIIHLKDSQRLEYYEFKKEYETQSIKVEIIDYQLGSEYPNDVCISELDFF